MHVQNRNTALDLRATEQEMDGEATVAAFATRSGPDCLKDVVPKLGSRLKVYNALKVVINDGYQQKVSLKHIIMHV